MFTIHELAEIDAFCSLWWAKETDRMFDAVRNGEPGEAEAICEQLPSKLEMRHQIMRMSLEEREALEVIVKLSIS